MVEHPGLFLRQDDDPAGTVGKSFKHRWLPALPHHRYKPVSGPSGNPAGPLWPESRTCPSTVMVGLPAGLTLRHLARSRTCAVVAMQSRPRLPAALCA
ncbi:hypothetical protein MLM_0700 [Mycobacterium lepraemurium]|nr:hypothetical protein MLM_0700 [Mycobacterium lepraemurium]